MSEKKSNTLFDFVKRNLYYLLIGIALLVIAVVISAVMIAENGKVKEAGKKLPSSSIDEPIDPSDPDTPTDPDKPTDPDHPSIPDDPVTPTPTTIVFDNPVANSTVLKEFTSSTVVFNKTLGVYTGHMGVDFQAEEGANVLAVYDGTVESITTSYLKGTTVTIDHGNGLKSVYNSLEANENLREGQTVKKGDILGYVSDNNRQEYKDGAHLHFEVLENGVNVNPYDYLVSSDK